MVHIDRVHPKGCWEWIATRNDDGYGKFFIRKGVPRYAHRVIWEWLNGPIPDGKRILHECDNPPCVRPDHLFIGNQHSNMQDMARKGRGWVQKYPERRAILSHLTKSDVIEMRRLHKVEGVSFARLAKMFGLAGKGAAWKIVKGITWSHVPDENK